LLDSKASFECTGSHGGNLEMVKNAYRKNLVLDIVNGIFYESAKIACKNTNEKYYTFIAKLSGRRKNNTNYINV